MAIWLIRAGSHGEYEQKFIQENRVYVTWDNLDIDLAKLKQRPDLTAVMTPLSRACHCCRWRKTEADLPQECRECGTRLLRFKVTVDIGQRLPRAELLGLWPSSYKEQLLHFGFTSGFPLHENRAS
jgi:hypothetical protein